MKQRIAFYIKKFLSGGMETTLVQYLRFIDTEVYDVTLVIGIETFPSSLLLKQIPANVKIVYLVNQDFFSYVPLLRHTAFCNNLHKILYNMITRPLTKIFLKYELIKVLKDFHSVVDYGLNLDGLARFIPGVKVGYFHFRIAHHYVPNRVSRRLHRVLKYYDKVVVINETMLHDAQTIYSEYKEKFVLFYNQFDFDSIRKLSNLNDDDAMLLDEYVVSSGRLIEDNKDFTTLIKAFATFKYQYHRYEKLLILGDGPDRVKLQMLIDSLGMSNDIRILGFKENPFTWVKHSKLFVLSSKHEGLSNVLIEAMVLDVPVLSTDCPDGPRDILMNGDAGGLVSVGDVEHLALMLNKILADIKYRDQIVTVASANINRFNIRKNIERFYLILFNQLKV